MKPGKKREVRSKNQPEKDTWLAKKFSLTRQEICFILKYIVCTAAD